MSDPQESSIKTSPNPLYRDFSEYLRESFPYKVQKISINAGFTCPNRDGSNGIGGCTYCNNSSFTPNYTEKYGSIPKQLGDGMAFFSYKYPEMKYLAYFQSYTNTYDTFESLRARYEAALSVDGVVGLVVGTRPDCMSRELLDYFEALSRQTFVYLEYGVESTEDITLEHIHRGHSYEDSCRTIGETAARGLSVGAHLILGLPGEDGSHFLRHARRLSALPLTSIKIHQLQILRGTVMGRDYLKNPSAFHLFDVDEYIYTVSDFVAHLRPDLYIDRFVSQSPPELLIAPRWNIKNYIFVQKLQKYMRANNLFQGRYYESEKVGIYDEKE